MTATWYKVQFHEASCQHCRRAFPLPLLGDQSYGQFILHGDRGGVFGFLSAFEEPAWENISEKLRRVQPFTPSPTRTGIGHLQHAVAALADTINGQALVLFPVCPSCHSESIAYGDSRPLDVREIPSVTFHDYGLLSEDQKTEKVRELWRHFA